jgi:hypothetical protein
MSSQTIIKEMEIGALSAFSSGVNGTIQISQTVYELKAVDQQARDLLETTRHVEHNLTTVRLLRRQKSKLLSGAEKIWIDGVITNTEATVQNVAALIEPARVDMRTKFGKVGFKNKLAFVLRDSPRVSTNLSRLSIANQSLSTSMSILSSREGVRETAPDSRHSHRGWIDSGGADTSSGNENNRHSHGSLGSSIVSTTMDPKSLPSYNGTISPLEAKRLGINNFFKDIPPLPDNIAELDSTSVSREAELFPEVVIKPTGQRQSISAHSQTLVEEKRVSEKKSFFITPGEYNPDRPMESGASITFPPSLGDGNGLQVVVVDDPEGGRAARPEACIDKRTSLPVGDIHRIPVASSEPVHRWSHPGHEGGNNSTLSSLNGISRTSHQPTRPSPVEHINVPSRTPSQSSQTSQRPHSQHHQQQQLTQSPTSDRNSIASTSSLPVSTHSQFGHLPTWPIIPRKEVNHRLSTSSFQTISGVSTMSDASTLLPSPTELSVPHTMSPGAINDGSSPGINNAVTRPMRGKDRREAWLQYQASRR